MHPTTYEVPKLFTGPWNSDAGVSIPFVVIFAQKRKACDIADIQYHDERKMETFANIAVKIIKLRFDQEIKKCACEPKRESTALIMR